MRVRWALTVRGTVQGVGFRPFVLRTARSHGLTGHVANRTSGVYIEVQGEPRAVAAFAADLPLHAPALCRIDSVRRENLPISLSEKEFAISESQANQPSRGVTIPPDTATCPQCRRETLAPTDRHYLYPFTNCTECGPRFSIIRSLPYDRPRTTMAGFEMCDDCAAEYHDPANRRFHAQPVACPACGPRLSLVDSHGANLATDDGGDAVIRQAAGMLAAGLILAIKGVGGFHLACDATNESAVTELRRRKRRPHKPLAVMCRDLDSAARICEFGPQAAGLLESPQAPVVLLRKRLPESVMAVEQLYAQTDTADTPAVLTIAPSVAPGLDRLGVMLPYTPMHLLLTRLSPPVLVMTSGNRPGQPLMIDDSTALIELAGIADGFLIHDRPIANRCDDSVAADLGGQVMLLRRSRGFVPKPIWVGPRGLGQPDTGAEERERRGEGEELAVLAVGGDQRAAACLLCGPQAVLSQHIGDVTNMESQAFLNDAVRKLVGLSGYRPQVVACDMHPGYRSREPAAALAAEYGARIMAIQHHHAHFASCLAACGHCRPAIGAILDGTGYGTGGQIWGFEIISGDMRSVRRHFHLQPVPMPGGDWAVRNPMVSAVAYLAGLLGGRGGAAARSLFGTELPELEMLLKLLGQRPDLPLVSSCGRLFDAVAAMTGVCRENTYDGRAPSEFGALVTSGDEGDTQPAEPYPSGVAGDEIRAAGVFAGILDDLALGRPVEYIARRFHETVLAMVVDAVLQVHQRTGLAAVALSGGCWQNEYLLAHALPVLRAGGLTVLVPSEVPVNDGGLSLGQAVIAAETLRRPRFPAARQLNPD